MGTTSSSDSRRPDTGGDTGAAEPVEEEPRVRCYYELLSVDKTATQEEIRKAYKRKAFELHPDKNYGDVERATKLFAEVQAAYQVLSDPEERASYDATSKRESRFRGGDMNHDSGDSFPFARTRPTARRRTTSVDIYHWMFFFPPKPNIDYSDSVNGFYAAVRCKFEKIAREENDACRKHGKRPPNLPEFGDSRCTYNSYVKNFYAHWSGFYTSRTFNWVQVHDVSSVGGALRTLFEMENSRIRSEAIQDYNESVRKFVKFIKKRDPRYTPPYAGMTNAERNAAMLQVSREQSIRARAKNAAGMKETKPSEQMEEVELNQSSKQEQSEALLYNCLVCRRSFKTESMLAAHEKTNKHKKVVTRQQQRMERGSKETGVNGGEDSTDIKGAMSDDISPALR